PVVEGKPGRTLGVQAKSLETGNLLAVIRQNTRQISPRRHVEERSPRVQCGNVGGVCADAGVNSRIDNASKRWSTAGTEVRPGLRTGACTEIHQCLQPGRVDALKVKQRPPKIGDGIVLRNRTKRREMKVVFLRRDGGL